MDFVVPVHFSKEHENMLVRCNVMPELNKGCIAMNVEKHAS